MQIWSLLTESALVLGLVSCHAIRLPRTEQLFRPPLPDAAAACGVEGETGFGVE